MPAPARLETARLVLRQWREDDLVPFWSMSRDPEVMRFLPELADKNASDALATRMRSYIDAKGWGFWAVEEKTGGAFTGCVGLHEMGADLPVPPGVEIGWRLARQFWGKGYATEAASACLAFGFEVLNLPDIAAYASLDNRRSRAVMERLGMRLTDVLFDHPMLAESDPNRRHCLYRIRREDWAAAGNPQ